MDLIVSVPEFTYLFLINVIMYLMDLFSEYFRMKRNTMDNSSAITDMIETRKQRMLSTFAALIDFRKAFDTIDRRFVIQ